LPSDDALEHSGAVIGEIRIEVQDVFDPEDPKEDCVPDRTDRGQSGRAP